MSAEPVYGPPCPFWHPPEYPRGRYVPPPPPIPPNGSYPGSLYASLPTITYNASYLSWFRRSK